MSVEAIKNDLKETERLLDLVEMGRLPPRRNIAFERRFFFKYDVCFIELIFKAISTKETEGDAGSGSSNPTLLHDNNWGT